MAVKTGLQRLATVIRWLSLAWMVLGVWVHFFGAKWDAIIAVGFFGIPGVLGFLLAYVLDGFGRKEG